MPVITGSPLVDGFFSVREKPQGRIPSDGKPSCGLRVECLRCCLYGLYVKEAFLHGKMSRSVKFDKIHRLQKPLRLSLVSLSLSLTFALQAKERILLVI